MGRALTGVSADSRERSAALGERARKACVWFVMGKGGVGRTTISAALAANCAARGEKTLIVQWSLGDMVSPLFGAASAMPEHEIAPRISTMRFSLDETLREYFVDHLGLGRFHDLVVRNRHVQRFTHAIPGLEELLFLGRLSWLSSIAFEERGWRYDRLIVDAPALGHGLSLFGVPRAAASLGLGGLLADECARVQRMLDERSLSILVTTAEELAVEETLELWPRLEIPPSLSLINRSLQKLGSLGDAPAWVDAPLLPLYQSLRRKREREELLAERLPHCLRVEEAFLGERDPLACAAAALEDWPCRA